MTRTFLKTGGTLMVLLASASMASASMASASMASASMAHDGMAHDPAAHSGNSTAETRIPVGSLVVVSPWARATTAKAVTGAAFFSVLNPGAEDDALLAAASPVADKVELHTHIHDNGVMRMRPVETIPVAAGGMAELKPGGLHVMLIGLKQPLVKGTRFPVTLTFARAGTATVMVEVGEPGAGMPGHGHVGH